MTPEGVDRAIERAVEQTGGVDRTVLDRITGSIQGSLRPVRPLPAPWLQTGALLAMLAAIAVLGAVRLGFFGVLRLGATQSAAIFLTLSGVACLTAMASVSAMTPGSKRIVSSAVLLVTGIAAPLGVFALIFHDYSLGRFVPQGVTCLTVGVLAAIPAGLLAAVILRRGYPVNAAAGVAAGTLAGFAGLTLLELHCSNFRAPHIMVWHVATVPLGALAGWAIYSLGWKRKDAELMQ